MCRWIAYRGETIPLEQYVTAPAHSLVVQSQRALESTAATNGDGFGMGWYANTASPGSTARSARPGRTRTCAISAAISARISILPMCAPRPARRSRARTAIPLPAAAGCSCTTA